MKNKLPLIILFFVIVINVLLLGWVLFHGADVALLNPKGIIAKQERDLMLVAVGVMLLIIGPVYFAIFFVARKYRESNSEISRISKPRNGWFIQVLWWIGPSIIIAILSLLAWKSTHALDPYRPISSNAEPVRIQVVALRWKWLFIYPEENIATVNFVQFPKDTPINFELTSDAPMNSFWIPSLSGQIYAMTGMSTKLHLVSSHEGDYPGFAAEINGIGFSGMKFVARSSTKDEFDLWAKDVRGGSEELTLSLYNKLSAPTTNHPVEYYSSVENDLYSKIIMKYMHSGESTTHYDE